MFKKSPLKAEAIMIQGNSNSRFCTKMRYHGCCYAHDLRFAICDLRFEIIFGCVSLWSGPHSWWRAMEETPTDPAAKYARCLLQDI